MLKMTINKKEKKGTGLLGEKIKLSLIGKSIIFVGSIIVGISIVQWFFRFPDVSQLASGVGIGMCFIAFGYIHSWMRSKDKKTDEHEAANRERFKELDEALDGVRIYQVDEIEKLNNKVDKN